MSNRVIRVTPDGASRVILEDSDPEHVETVERAIEIAAQSSASPGPNGVPIRQPIEVREVLSAPDPEV